MMIGRERASVEEGRVEGGRVAGGNERGRDRPRERGEGGIEQGREGNFKGGILGPYACRPDSSPICEYLLPGG